VSSARGWQDRLRPRGRGKDFGHHDRKAKAVIAVLVLSLGRPDSFVAGVTIDSLFLAVRVVDTVMSIDTPLGHHLIIRPNGLFAISYWRNGDAQPLSEPKQMPRDRRTNRVALHQVA